MTSPKARLSMRIGPKSARAFQVVTGEVVRVIDPSGAQVADFVCLSATDKGEYLSQARTRVNNWTYRPTKGSVLYSNRNRPMFTLGEDTVGVHDLLFSPCSSFIYEQIYKVGPRSGCLENLSAALAKHGVSADLVPDPLNIFMNTHTNRDGSLAIERAPSQPGDHLDLRAEMDAIVAVSACADDLDECNGGQCTPIDVQVLEIG